MPPSLWRSHHFLAIRLDFASNLPDYSTDDGIGTLIASIFGEFTAIAYDGCSRYGYHEGTPRSLSAIDRILVDFEPAELIDVRPVAIALVRPTGKHSLSDHFQIVAGLRADGRRPASRRGWPKRLLEWPEL